VLDDYAHLLTDVISDAPSTLFLSPTFPGAVQSTISTLTLLTAQTVLAALDVIRAIIGHDSLQYDPSDPSMAPYAAVYPAYAQSIRSVMETVSFQLVGILLDGLVAALEDTTSNILTVFRMLSVQFPQLLAAAIPSAVEALSSKVVGGAEKVEFLNMFNLYVQSLSRRREDDTDDAVSRALGAQNPNRVKEAFTWLLRTSNKSRERARLSESRR
jgi:transportin-3